MKYESKETEINITKIIIFPISDQTNWVIPHVLRYLDVRKEEIKNTS